MKTTKTIKETARNTFEDSNHLNLETADTLALNFNEPQSLTIFYPAVENRAPKVTYDFVKEYVINTPTLLCDQISVIDEDGDADWNGGLMAFFLAENGQVSDRVGFSTTYAANSIWADSGSLLLKYGNTTIASLNTWSVTVGGFLIANFNANANNEIVQLVARSVTYVNDGSEPIKANKVVGIVSEDRYKGSTLTEIRPKISGVPEINNIPKNAIEIATGQENNLPNITVFDKENDDLTVTVTVTNGSLRNIEDADLGTPGIQLKGKAASINNELSNIKFTSSSNGTASVQLAVDDGNTQKVVGTINYNSTGNATPTTSNSSLLTNEDASYTLKVADFKFSDTDGSDSLQSVTVSPASKGKLFFNGTSVNETIEVSVADINAGKLVFTPVSNENGSNYSSLNFKVSDGKAWSSQATMNFSVIAVNDAPTTTNITLTTNEDTAKVLSISDFTFSDIDDATYTGVTFTSLPNSGTLNFNGNPVKVGDTVTKAGINAGLFSFTPALNGNGNGYANFKFKVSDGALLSNEATATINVTAVNDAPTTTNITLATYEDTAIVLGTSDFTFSDIDSATYTGVTITSLPISGTLNFNGNPVKVGDTVTKAGINAGLFSFTPALNGNGNDYANFKFKLSDGDSLSNEATATINVTPVNDAPTTTNVSITTNEDTSRVLSASDFTFSDVENEEFSSITFTSVPKLGSLTYKGEVITAGLTVSAEDINDGLVSFTPALNAYGENYTSFSFTLSDGEIQTNEASITINVNSVNDAPKTNNSYLNSREDVSHTIALSQFSFSDVDVGDAMTGIMIKQLPAAGNLYLNNSKVVESTFVSVSDIQAGKLTYLGNLNGNGSNYAQFGFTVVDKANDQSNNALVTISVTPINDAPTGTITVQGIFEKGQTLRIKDTIADVDGINTIYYQWLANGNPISGATGTSLVLDRYLVGKTISVKASFVDNFGTAESVLSNTTTTIIDPNNTFSGNVFINGLASVGETLTATHNFIDKDGLGAISYQWSANGVVINGANKASLVLDSSLLGKQISVTASYIDGKGNLETSSYDLNTFIGNSVQGGTGNDVLKGTAGNDIINGGNGLDVVQLNGKLADYTIKNVNGKFIVTAKSGNEGVDTLSNIETLKFSDLSINLTTQGKVPSAPNANELKVMELYIAFFNRIPEADGLVYWIDQLNNGVKIDQIAESFYNAGVHYSALTGYTKTMSNADFVNVIYKNTLGRKDGADADGLKYWTEQLASGKATRGSLVNEILNSAHSFKGKAELGWVADLLDNKVKVTKTLAIDWGINFNTPEESISKGMAIASVITANDYQTALNTIGINAIDINLTGIAPVENGIALM